MYFIDMLRSIAAIGLGLLMFAVDSFGIEGVLSFLLLAGMPDAFPNRAVLNANTHYKMVELFYVFLCAMLSGYITGMIIYRSELKHAVILAVIQEVLNVIYLVEHPHDAPAWYWAATLVFVPGGICLGGWMHSRRRSRGLRRVSSG